MQLLYSPFSMTSTIVVCLFLCKGIIGHFYSSVPQNKQFQKKELMETRKNEIFLVSIVQIDLEKLNI